MSGKENNYSEIVLNKCDLHKNVFERRLAPGVSPVFRRQREESVKDCIMPTQGLIRQLHIDIAGTRLLFTMYSQSSLRRKHFPGCSDQYCPVTKACAKEQSFPHCIQEQKSEQIVSALFNPLQRSPSMDNYAIDMWHSETLMIVSDHTGTCTSVIISKSALLTIKVVTRWYPPCKRSAYFSIHLKNPSLRSGWWTDWGVHRRASSISCGRNKATISSNHAQSAQIVLPVQGMELHSASDKPHIQNKA